MKQKLSPQEDARLLKNRIKKFFGVYQYIDPDMPHGSEFMRRNQRIEDNKLAYSILFAIVLLFSLMLSAVLVAMWVIK